jgi:hypothetical protein
MVAEARPSSQSTVERAASSRPSVNVISDWTALLSALKYSGLGVVSQRESTYLLIGVGQRHGERHRLALDVACVAGRVAVGLVVSAHWATSLCDVDACDIKTSAVVELHRLIYSSVGAVVIETSALFCDPEADMIAAPRSGRHATVFCHLAPLSGGLARMRRPLTRPALRENRYHEWER